MSEQDLELVRYSRQATQGVVLGVTRAGLWSAGVALTPVIVAVVVGGLLPALVVFVITSPLLLLGILKHQSISRVVWMFWKMKFQVRKMFGLTKYRRKPGPVVHGSLALPGFPNRFEVWTSENGAAIVWDKANDRASVTCMVATEGLARHRTQAMTGTQREQLTAAFMQVAGSWTRRKQIVRVSLQERTRPGTVVREQRHFDALNVEGDLAESYQEALNQAGEMTVLRPQGITITLDTKGGPGGEAVKAHGGGKAGVMHMVEQEMAATAESLYQAGFTRVRWCSPREWGAWGRGIVDPVAEAKVDARVGTAFEGVAPELAAPLAFDEQKNHSETDSAFHCAYWVQEWPRLDVLPGFMGQIAFAETYAGVPVRHTLQIVGQPVALEDAIRRIKKDRETWKTNANLRRSRGHDSSIADDADWHNLDDRERELVNGQGELAWSAFIVVSALSLEALHSACSSMEIAASSASIELMKLTWQQGAALSAVAYPAGQGMG